jgi:hypothetical protein
MIITEEEAERLARIGFGAAAKHYLAKDGINPPSWDLQTPAVQCAWADAARAITACLEDGGGNSQKEKA